MLGQVMREAAERFGDATAYVAADGWPLSYCDLDSCSDGVAAGLAGRGISEGDVAAVVLPPIPEYVVLYLALAKLGAVTAGVNARLAPPERDAVLAAARPTVVLATADLAPTSGHDVIEVVPADGLTSLLRSLRTEGGASVPALARDAERPVAIVFTSGTTGTPKGAVFAGRQLAAITTIDTGDRWGGGGATFAATSFAHLGPMTKLPGALRRGGTTYLMARWRAADALRMVAEHRMTSVGGIPTQVALMLQDPDFDRHDLSSVQAIVVGGGPATPALVREARARFGAALAIRYSCTEAGIGVGTALTDPPEDAEVSVGRPLPGVELSLRTPEHQGGHRGDAVAAGDVGEVCLRSAAMMSGYHDDPIATAAAFTADGFVRTGDLGWLDDAGRLRLVGRSKEMYVRGGYNVYPMEVEAVLATHPGVADVAVAPRPDDVMGEVGVVVVVARAAGGAPSLDELRAFASDRLARYKLPEAMRVVDALPLTPMEKLDRRALAEWVLR